MHGIAEIRKLNRAPHVKAVPAETEIEKGLLADEFLDALDEYLDTKREFDAARADPDRAEWANGTAKDVAREVLREVLKRVL